MHSAPSVTYPVGRSRFTGSLVLVAAGCGVAAALPGAFQASGFPLFASAGVAIAVAAAGWAGLFWWRTPRGELSWDGQSWAWSGDDASDGFAASPELLVCLDLQSAVLLRQPLRAGGSRWLWLERSRSPQRWAALRRAVYSPATREAIPGLLPARSKP